MEGNGEGREVGDEVPIVTDRRGQNRGDEPITPIPSGPDQNGKQVVREIKIVVIGIGEGVQIQPGPGFTNPDEIGMYLQRAAFIFQKEIIAASVMNKLSAAPSRPRR